MPGAWPATGSTLRLRVAWAAGVLVVFALALLVRALWASYAEADPADGRLDDSVFYDYAARSLADGRGYVSPWTGEETALFPPGYPFFLAGLYAVFGADPQVGESANVLLGAATCGLAFALGRLLFGWKAGLAAGLILAFFPGQALFVPALMSEGLFTFLFVAALLLAVLTARRAGRDRMLLAAATGLAAGLAALVRGEGLFIPVMILPFWALAWADWRTAFRGGALVAAAMLALVLPWSARNYLIMDSPILLSSNIGGNFLMGRYAGTMERVEAADDLMASYRGLPPKEQEVKMNTVGWREGLELALTKPWRELQIAGPKLKALYDRDDDFLLHGEGFASGRRFDEPLRSVLQWTANSYYFVVLGLAGLGAVVAWSRHRPAAVLLVWTVLLWTLNETLMIADSRYHLPLVPVFVVLGASGVMTLVDAVRTRTHRPAILSTLREYV
jgi:4-amino-4-deoxy-L-arabinose transferase-like glycosyltransferase